jgi:hypothetical protein
LSLYNNTVSVLLKLFEQLYGNKYNDYDVKKKSRPYCLWSSVHFGILVNFIFIRHKFGTKKTYSKFVYKSITILFNVLDTQLGVLTPLMD